MPCKFLTRQIFPKTTDSTQTKVITIKVKSGMTEAKCGEFQGKVFTNWGGGDINKNNFLPQLGLLNSLFR